VAETEGDATRSPQRRHHRRGAEGLIDDHPEERGRGWQSGEAARHHVGDSGKADRMGGAYPQITGLIGRPMGTG
jgi:hypothetical protein